METVCVDSLIIETTRKCNMSCLHCLRGNAQNRVIGINYIMDVFEQIDAIHSITLSGGEPSLVPDTLMAILDLAKKFDVDIDNFFIATNGKEVSDKFLRTIMEYWLYCGSNEISGVRLSTDKYHEQVDEDNIKLLQAFSFFMKDRNSRGVINEGNAENLDLPIVRWGHHSDKPFKFNQISGILEVEEYPITTLIRGDMYLNCEGNIIEGCDYSYENQKMHVVCSSSDDIMKSIKEFCERNENE